MNGNYSWITILLFLLTIFFEIKINSGLDVYTYKQNLVKSWQPIIDKVTYLSKPKEISSTFMQSRRFHWEQTKKDNRDLDTSYFSYTMNNQQSRGYSQEACRLTSLMCSHDYQCCSGKCRCVRWTVLGTMSCWKKCY